MAIYGAPIEQPRHARHACASALAMQERLAAMNVEWQKMGRPALEARIGINTGPMLVGNLGSPYRFSYGVVGDKVNLASRLEGLNTIYGTQILIGEETANQVGESFTLREVDLVRVKGMTHTGSIFELMGPADRALPPGRSRARARYGEGLEFYKEGDWARALKLFQEAMGIWPEDGPARHMAERCLRFIAQPPGEGWDGTFDHLSKE
jgi:adenylate cyclase